MKVWRFCHRLQGRLRPYAYIRAENPCEFRAIIRKIESGECPNLRVAPEWAYGPRTYRAQFIMDGPRRQAVLHDYTRKKRGWGHDIHFRPIDPEGLRLDAGGWGRGIQEGDYILITNPDSGSDTRYQVESIEYHIDPSDQWRGVLAFAPRQAEASA